MREIHGHNHQKWHSSKSTEQISDVSAGSALNHAWIGARLAASWDIIKS